MRTQHGEHTVSSGITYLIKNQNKNGVIVVLPDGTPYQLLPMIGNDATRCTAIAMLERTQLEAIGDLVVAHRGEIENG